MWILTSRALVGDGPRQPLASLGNRVAEGAIVAVPVSHRHPAWR